MSRIPELFDELEILTGEVPNSTHYFSYSRSKRAWVFRFQQFRVVVENGYRQTVFFRGEDPEKVIDRAVTYLREVRNKNLVIPIVKTGINGVESNTDE